MPDERDQADQTDGTRARQLEAGHTRHTFERDGRVIEVDVDEMSEVDYARHVSALGPLHSAVSLAGRVRVVRLIR
jgi:predicted transcriptional regulator